MELFENERLDKVNDDLSLIQKSDGLMFGTDALLLAGYINSQYGCGIEFGGGSGIISLLLLTRGKLKTCKCVEAQAEYAELTERNARLNSLEERLTAVHADVRELKTGESFDLVFTNPPYMKSSSGKSNETEKKNLARHELKGGIEDFLIAAKKCLKFGGAFAAVYRPDRLCDLLHAMRCADIEPKRMTFVHADTESEPSMVLVEGKRGGRSGMKLTKPLIIYKDGLHKEYTSDMDYIMEWGYFPEEYSLTNSKRKQTN